MRSTSSVGRAAHRPVGTARAGVHGAGATSILIVAAASIALTGCTGTPAPVSTSPSASPSPAPSASPSAAPTLNPAGTAEENLPYFDSVNAAFLTVDPTPGGRAIVDNLVAAGFDKSAMQVTPDRTSIGNAVDSVQFSVLFSGECLIGQASASGYVGTVGPIAEGTSCLIGSTRVIDW